MSRSLSIVTILGTLRIMGSIDVNHAGGAVPLATLDAGDNERREVKDPIKQRQVSPSHCRALIEAKTKGQPKTHVKVAAKPINACPMAATLRISSPTLSYPSSPESRLKSSSQYDDEPTVNAVATPNNHSIIVPAIRPSHSRRSSATLAPGWMPRRPPRVRMQMPSAKVQIAETAAY